MSYDGFEQISLLPSKKSDPEIEAKIESIFEKLIPKREVYVDSLKSFGIAYLVYRILKYRYRKTIRDQLLTLSKYH